MDRFTRNYSIVLGLILLVVLGGWLKSAWQPRVWEINEKLAADPVLAQYPYPFRLRALRDGVAVLSTPRSPEFPAIRFLAVIQPELANKDQDDPAMIAAQQALIEHQRHAQALLLAQPGVTRVDWELDTQWLASRGVHIDAGR